MDHSGNSVSTRFGPVNIDETAPLISVTSGLADGTTYSNAELQSGVSTNSATLRLTGTSHDALSGLDFVRVAGLEITGASRGLFSRLLLLPCANQFFLVSPNTARHPALL